MNAVIFLFVLVVVFVSTSTFASVETSLDAIAGKRFDFHQFENFDGNTNAYIEEIKIVQKLKDIKRKLEETKENVKNKEPNKSIENVRQLVTILKSYQRNETKDFPKKEDYYGAVRGMMTLFYTYHFNLTEVTLNGRFSFRRYDGETFSFPCHERLNIKDLEMLTDLAIERRIFSAAIQMSNYIDAVLPYVNSTDKKFLKKFSTIKKNLYKINNGYLEKQQKFLNQNYEVLPFMVNKKLYKKSKQPWYVQNGQTFKVKVDHEKANDWLFLKICRDGRANAIPNRNKPQVHCRFLHHMDPYLKLGPFKEEQKAAFPYLVVYHDILSEKEINYLIESARPNLSRTRSYDDDASTAKYRHELKGKRKVVHKTVQAWLPEVDWPWQDIELYVGKNYTQMNHEILWKLAAKIKLATQLETQTHLSSTQMQVTNYGLSGLCETHIDPHGQYEVKELGANREHLRSTGDMIGTFMAWLSNTEAGGATAFAKPPFEEMVLPEKGSAAFWYDLNSSLFRDHNSRHAGCPVIKGSKWILNKWIYAYDNFAKFPCNLIDQTLFAPPNKNHYL